MRISYASRNTPRLAAVGILLASLLTTGSVFAEPAPTSGTLVGSVTCGPNESSLAPNTVVSIAGIDLSTHSDASGGFRLVGVPTGQLFTVEAVSDSAVADRFNVSAQAGQVLDIGALDLAVCPPAAANAAPAQDQPTDNREGSQ
jgi:hypothetical protein